MAKRYFRQKSVKTIWFVWCIIILLLVLSSCVPVYQYHYRDLEYIPFDIHDRPINIYDYRYRDVINVYVPKYRSPAMYRYNGVYYTEPYTTMMYRDVQGRLGPRRVPNSVVKKIHREHDASRRFPAPKRESSLSRAPQNIIKKQRKQRENFFKDDTADQKSDRKVNRNRIRSRR